MKTLIVIFFILALLAAGGGYYYYESHLRFTDAYTDCPVLGLRETASTAESAIGFVTETNLKSLKETERCFSDCRHDNYLACVIYGVALYQGVLLMKDEKRGLKIIQGACTKREPLACQVEEQLRKWKDSRAEQEAQEADLLADKGLFQQLARAKGESARTIRACLNYFGGNARPMMTPAMVKWAKGTVRYLLYEKPLLSQMHPGPGGSGRKLDLKGFVTAKYLRGEFSNDQKFQLASAFFEKLKRLGVMQIRLDYHVENKKESSLKKTHDYFKAKNTFLYHVAKTEVEIFESIEALAKTASH